MENDPYKRPQHPVLIVIAGPSGAGKDTIARMLMDNRAQNFYFVVTATTREPREGEVHGVDYFFVSNDEFARMIDEDELVEYAVVYSDYKGVPKQQIRDALASGKDVIMRVDVQGAATIRKQIPNAITVFLSVESEESLIRRLEDRQSETANELKLRIATARKEMERIPEFDYCVTNWEGRPESAVDDLVAIIRAEKLDVQREPIEL